MRANKLNPTLIQITSRGQILGTLTCQQFREASGSRNDFIGNLVEKFNAEKARIGEPERAEQILNAK
jgi:hypothetical protein